ncbi:MAG: rRNA maturation RNase YbeY [Nitrospirae bacterium]|nr:rRNA maturation RNase YbeY [Nitrospirota bacterium]
MKILIKNQQKHRALNKTKIAKATRKILSLLEKPMAELSILFVGDRKISQLNADYRGINKSTDVLSFPQINRNLEVRTKKFEKDKNMLSSSSHFPLLTSQFLLGDIVINIPHAEYQAKIYGWSFYDELLRLLIHGTLHLLGYDHEKSVYKARMMRKKELEVFNAVKKMDSKH